MEFKELLQLLLDNQEWIIEDALFEEILKIIQSGIPELVKVDKEEKMTLKFSVLEMILSNTVILPSQKKYVPDYFPSFKDIKYGLPTKENKKEGDFETEEITEKRVISINLLHEVSKLGIGDSFGELALLNDEPRRATIICCTPCCFATLEKDKFKKVFIYSSTNKFSKEKLS